MNAAEQLQEFLLDHSGGHARVDIELLRRAFHSVHPELASTAAARPKLRELLDLLELDGRIQLPKGKEGWDRSSLPPLPLWVRLAHEVVPAPERVDLREIPWAPELRFLAGIRPGVPFDCLLKLQEFFANGGRDRELVPLKERSLQIFGDEKRLDTLIRSSSLFAPGRLTLEQLSCVHVAEPLAWERGPTPHGPVIVIENAATWYSYCRWNRERGYFSAVVYGCGNQFMHSVAYIGEVFREIGSHPIRYFGDLDPPGLRIPRLASAKASSLGLPIVEPDTWSYRRLLELGRRNAEAQTEPLDYAAQDLEWLKDLARQVSALFAQRCRLAQEHVGWELLRASTWDPGDIVES